MFLARSEIFRRLGRNWAIFVLGDFFCSCSWFSVHRSAVLRCGSWGGNTTSAERSSAVRALLPVSPISVCPTPLFPDVPGRSNPSPLSFLFWSCVWFWNRCLLLHILLALILKEAPCRGIALLAFFQKRKRKNWSARFRFVWLMFLWCFSRLRFSLDASAGLRDGAWAPAWWLSYSCCLLLLMEEVVPCDSLMLVGLLLYINWHQNDFDSKLALIVRNKQDNYLIFIDCAMSGISMSLHLQTSQML